MRAPQRSPPAAWPLGQQAEQQPWGPSSSQRVCGFPTGLRGWDHWVTFHLQLLGGTSAEQRARPASLPRGAQP